MVASYEYDPYGGIAEKSGTLADINPMRYRGYYYDTETGFYYLQSRYYDPGIGRFINADAFTSTGQGILGNNMFAYCNNSPVSNADFSGHALDTVIDAISFASSAADFIANPNLWTFACVSGDFIDMLIPFVGGIGETVRVASVVAKVADIADDAIDANNVVDNVIDSHKLLNFQTEELMLEHYGKHNKDFGNAFGSPQSYLDAANYVIKNGQFLESKNAYVKFYGYKGRANYAFVGLTQDRQFITTFHLKDARKVFN